MRTIVATSLQSVRSPAFRVRMLLPAPGLVTHGLRTEALPLFTPEEEVRFRTSGTAAKLRTLGPARRRLGRRLASNAGTVVVQRQVDMAPTLGLERLAARASRLVYDVDDAVWKGGDPAAGGHALAWLKQSARKAAWLAGRADQVVAGNEILAEWLRSQTSAPIAIVPSLVDISATPLRRHDDRVDIVLGWIGSSTTRAYLDRVTGALSAAARARPDRRFVLEVVGGAPVVVPGVEVRTLPWSEEAELGALRRMDVGLMPLPDTPWTRGKCAYKAQQYMAAGVPVVADDVGISARVIGADAAGLLPTGEGAWTDALIALTDDVGLRTRLGTEGRLRSEREFSLAGWTAELARLVGG